MPNFVQKSVSRKMRRDYIVGFLLVSCIFCAFGNDLADWDFTLVRFEYNSSNPELVNFNLRCIRTTGGVYALNGTFFIGVNMDDTFWGSVKVFRSQARNSQFQDTPFEVAITPFFGFMSYVYVKILQREFIKCSNMPTYTEQFDKPLPTGMYYLKKCRMSNKDLPGHLQPGLYKIAIHITGKDLELFMSVYLDVKAKLAYKK